MKDYFANLIVRFGKLLLPTLVVLIYTFSASATPTVLATFTSIFGVGVGGWAYPFDGDPQNIIFTWGLCPQISSSPCGGSYDGSGLPAQPRLSTNMFSPSSAPRSFTFNASSDPDFVAIAKAITTSDPYLFWSVTWDTLQPPPWCSGCRPPSYPGFWFLNVPSSLTAPGAVIDSLVVTIDATYVYKYEDMWMISGAPSGSLTPVNFTIDAHGSPAPTPEPGSFILLGSGVLGLGAVLRRKLMN